MSDDRRAGLDGALGVFGGTFDPIHVAHLAVAEGVRDALGLRRVLFVPAATAPHKTDRPVSPGADRLAMVRLAIADNAAFEASPIELEREGLSYTIDTLRALTAAAHAAGDDPRLALILSAEAYADFATWRDPDAIRALATLVVVPRDGYPDVAPEPGMVVLDGPRVRLSASELRSRARAGRSLRYLVPDAVAAYIGDHGLYQDHRRDETR
ncbi:MAG: nicotinate-nucleotide adenylyltransferase [Candidatus Limnocylindria bacterium]